MKWTHSCVDHAEAVAASVLDRSALQPRITRLFHLLEGIRLRHDGKGRDPFGVEPLLDLRIGDRAGFG